MTIIEAIKEGRERGKFIAENCKTLTEAREVATSLWDMTPRPDWMRHLNRHPRLKAAHNKAELTTMKSHFNKIAREKAKAKA